MVDTWIRNIEKCTPMAYIKIAIVIIETSIFTRRLKELMSDEEYKELQQALIRRPDMGNIIQNTGGLRKVRWKLEGKSKRGGVRVIYYWMSRYTCCICIRKVSKKI